MIIICLSARLSFRGVTGFCAAGIWNRAVNITAMKFMEEISNAYFGLHASIRMQM
jgi:hypothetical protein